MFEDTRADYGEVRMIAIGEISGEVFKVVFTDRGEVRRIISAHRASRQEKRKWQIERRGKVSLRGAAAPTSQ